MQDFRQDRRRFGAKLQLRRIGEWQIAGRAANQHIAVGKVRKERFELVETHYHSTRSSTAAAACVTRSSAWSQN
jgi:hypothetical protein